MVLYWCFSVVTVVLQWFYTGLYVCVCVPVQVLLPIVNRVPPSVTITMTITITITVTMTITITMCLCVCVPVQVLLHIVNRVSPWW
jgi:hypothetical protein